MAKPRIPNQKQKYQELNKRLMKYVTLVEQIYDNLNLEAAKVAKRTLYDAGGEKPFKFSNYPQTKDAIAKLQAQFVSDISAVIYTGTSKEWKESNLVQDLVADKVLKAYGAEVNGKKYEVFYQTNSDALKAFQQRKDKGFNISNKLWNQSKVYKDELEAAISCAIEKGTSAVTLSKQISKYLQDFPSLQKDYKQKYGKAADIYDCEYRSIRLARSEINMAYRKAEQTRWQQFDFVVGYEIKLSNNHNCKGIPAGQFYDICDELAGKYPKTFRWSGWHVNCRCYQIPILKTEEEFWEWDEDEGSGTDSVNEVKDVPENFKQWTGTNSQRIADATKRGTLPYFIKDNKSLVDDILTSKPIGEVVYSIGGVKQLSVLDGRNYKTTKAVSDIEAQIRENKTFETGVVFDVNGNVIIDKRGENYIVRFTESETAKMKDCVFTHNHPRGWKYAENDIGRIGSSFSIQDITLAVSNDLAEIRAVTPNYTFSMKRPKEGWEISVKDLIRIYDEENDSLHSEFMKRINNNTMTISQANATHFHILWKRISEKVGFEYRKLKTK